MLYPKEGRMDMRPAPILKAHGKRSKMNTFNVVLRDASAPNQTISIALTIDCVEIFEHCNDV